MYECICEASCTKCAVTYLCTVLLPTYVQCNRQPNSRPKRVTSTNPLKEASTEPRSYLLFTYNHHIYIQLHKFTYNQHPKAQSRKKAHKPLPTSWISPKTCLPSLIITQSFDHRINVFSLRDMRFLLCSLDLDVLRAQRSMGFFILITHKPTRSENPITWLFVLV